MILLLLADLLNANCGRGHTAESSFVITFRTSMTTRFYSTAKETCNLLVNNKLDEQNIFSILREMKKFASRLKCYWVPDWGIPNLGQIINDTNIQRIH